MYQRLTAGELCTRDTVFADKTLSLQEAARLMREQHVGSLVVTEETNEGRVAVGMLTDRDIVTAVVAKDLDARTLRAEDVMSADLVSVREPDSLLDVLDAMRRKGVRRVPVTDARGVLRGVLALDDLLEVLAEQMHAVVQVIGSARQREESVRP